MKKLTLILVLLLLSIGFSHAQRQQRQQRQRTSLQQRVQQNKANSYDDFVKNTNEKYQALCCSVPVPD